MTKAEYWQCQKKNAINVRIAETYNQPWRGFTLQKGHLFGQDRQGYFVSAARLTANGNAIHIHRCSIINGDYKWRSTTESVNSATAKKILEAAQDKPPIEYEPVEKQIKRFYNPPIVTGEFTPMPHMRIPGGAY